jgi:hypothetical protein
MERGLHITYEKNMKCGTILVGNGRGHLENPGMDEAIIFKAGCEDIN